MGITLKTWQAYGYDKTGDGVIDEADLKRIRQPVVWLIGIGLVLVGIYCWKKICQ